MELQRTELASPGGGQLTKVSCWLVAFDRVCAGLAFANLAVTAGFRKAVRDGRPNILTLHA